VAPQIGIRHDLEEKWRWVTEEEFLAIPDREIKGRAICVLTPPDEESRANLVAVVQQRVPDFEPRTVRREKLATNPDGKIEMAVDATVDAPLARAISKIAFNYLAHVTGSEFALRSCFDPLRAFVRWGSGSWPLTVKPGPLLRLDETANKRVTRAHLVTVAWRGPFTASQIVGQVSLFNGVVYEVMLCERYPSEEVWRPVDSGHQFDWEKRKIRPLSRVNMDFARTLGWGAAVYLSRRLNGRKRKRPDR
jgi:hypothetical protein